jgi:hypothetical protein
MHLLRRYVSHFSVSKFNLSKDYYKILGVKQSSS